MASRRYPSDLTDEEWYLLEPHLPAPKKRGRPRLHSPREILDAVFYVLKSGCQWRMLPRAFPPWKTVFHYFRRWSIDGIWERLNRLLRRRLREKLGRDPEPSAAIVGAKVADQDGIRRLLDPARSRLPRLSYLWVDAGYRGRGKKWAEEALGVEVEIVNRSPKPPPEKALRIWAREWFKVGREMDLGKLPKRPAFENLPRRWVAERTFAWISHNRRMAKAYEKLCSTGEALIHATMARLMVKRLARA
jgi:putative transposase